MVRQHLGNVLMSKMQCWEGKLISTNGVVRNQDPLRGLCWVGKPKFIIDISSGLLVDKHGLEYGGKQGFTVEIPTS